MSILYGLQAVGILATCDKMAWVLRGFTECLGDARDFAETRHTSGLTVLLVSKFLHDLV